MVIENERMMSAPRPPPPSNSRIPLRSADRVVMSRVVIAAVALALGACGSDSVEKVRDAALAGEASALERLRTAESELEAARMRAEAAEAALSAAQEAALLNVGEALDLAAKVLSGDGGEGARQELEQQLRDTNEQLAAARTELGTPTDAAGRETVEALRLTETALSAAERALGLAAQVGSGSLLAASAHTLLDEALSAVDDAQEQLDRAAEAVDDAESAAGRALQAARGALTTAQVSLLPKIRQELETAEAARSEAARNEAEQRTRADAAERERNEARSEAAEQRSEAAEQRTRADAAEEERDAARSGAEEQRERADAAEEERDAARSEAEEQRERADAAEGEAEEQRERADDYDPRVSLTAALLPREGRFVPRVEGSITRTPRTDTGEAGWTKLDIATDAVAFTAGRRVGAASGGLRATDELPLRSVTLRAAGRHPIKIQGDDGTPSAYGNTDGVLESALRIGSDSVTLKFGGEGVVYYDMQRTFDYYNNVADTDHNQDAWWRYGPDGKLGDATAASGGTITASHARDLGLDAAGGTLTADQATALQGYVTDNSGACWGASLADCGDWAHDDLTIAFGAPAQAPEGDPAWYWKVRAPLTREQRDTALPHRMDPDHDDDDGRPEEIGTYELWLSHHGGVDDKGTAAANDDTRRYLEYAAYGLFQVFDNAKATPSFVRPQAFAFGYDAFADSSGMRTTDIATSVEATFKGRTMARALINNGDQTNIILTGATPLRGDITLNACIGGSACTGTGIPSGANRISGMISGLEELRHDGVWIPHSPAAGGIPMAEGDIAADGSFGGQLDHPRTADGTDNSWDYDANIGNSNHPSKYGGNLYGPAGALEAAGWWHVQVDNRDRALRSSIIGSFGAKCTAGCGGN